MVLAFGLAECEASAPLSPLRLLAATGRPKDRESAQRMRTIRSARGCPFVRIALPPSCQDAQPKRTGIVALAGHLVFC